MKRRTFLLFTATAVMVVVATLGMQKKSKSGLLLLEWAAKGDKTAPPTAVLLEMGLKDVRPVDWSGRAKVTGAKVVHREGYRFRKGDELTDPDGWKASSHRGLRIPPRMPVIARMEGIATVGVVLHLDDIKDDAKLTLDPRPGSNDKKSSIALKDVLSGAPVSLWGGAARVRLVTTATRLTDGKTEDDFPAACYGPDGTLWVAYIAYTLKDEGRRIEAAPLKEQPADFKQFYTPEFGDQLFVCYYRSGKWSKPFAVTGAKEDFVRCAIAAEKSGDVWVVYSANRKGNYDLYARKLDLNTPEAVSHPKPNIGPEKRLTDNPGSDLSPVLCTTQKGELRLAYQTWRQGRGADIGFFSCKAGTWTVGFKEHAVDNQAGTLSPGGNSWYPVIAAGLEGNWTTLCDNYRHGEGGWDYQIPIWRMHIDVFSIGSSAQSSPFEARPSVVYDTRGRLWIAYEAGPERWGKDYGAFVIGKGHPLYDQRSVRVVCLEDGKQKRPVAELPTSTVEAPVSGNPQNTQKFEKAKRYAYPQIGLDGKGRIWLTYRESFSSRYSTHLGSYWLTLARRLDGDKWSEPIEVHHSDGLLDSRPVLLPHAAGGLLVLHNTDGRYTTPETVQNRIYTSYIDLPGDPVEPKLVAQEPGKLDEQLVKQAEKEQEAVKRIRDYAVKSGGKKYRLLRGEFHRHTEMSWDGGADGSLEDMFRYAIDAAELDWIGNGDHDNGAGREYSWWLTQKFSDAYHIPGRFTPMFSYERSVAYPHGHRNCLFAKRGVRTLPRLAEPNEKKRVGGVHADDTKMLYRYLKELDGICAVHTSATSMGTDWRDNDPEVEPIVEIYQGDRMSYERQGAPRAGYEAKSGKKPVNIAGWYPDGFIDRALDKGYKLGFQASSDHWSTHISYFVVLAEKNDRESILEAIKKRHCYAATDNIVLDVRCGDHLMGDAFNAREAPVFQLRVVGTGKLEGIDFLADGKVVDTIKPDGSDYQGEWKVPKKAGSHYYYVRVRQADGELAWSSPLWVESKP
jgi:hypothetical protein